MAAPQEITVQVKLDEKTFKRFARFDTIRLRKKWIRPLLFALILCAFAFVALWSRRPQSGLIAAVLLCIGLGLPIVYIGMFLSQVNVQAARWKLGKGKNVYNVTLQANGFQVISRQKSEEKLYHSWKETSQAIRVRKCIYLYATPAKAFLLPEGQANVSDDQLWDAIVQGLGEAKCKDQR